MSRLLAAAIALVLGTMSVVARAQTADETVVVAEPEPDGGKTTSLEHELDGIRFSAGLGSTMFWNGNAFAADRAVDLGGSLAFDWQHGFDLHDGHRSSFDIGPHVAWTHQGDLTTGALGAAIGFATLGEADHGTIAPRIAFDFLIGAALAEDRRPMRGLGLLFGWLVGARLEMGWYVAQRAGFLLGIEGDWLVGAGIDTFFLGGHFGYFGEWP